MEYVKISLAIAFLITIWVAIITTYIKKKPSEFKKTMDEYTTERYLKCLNDMVQLITYKRFNSLVGELERAKMAVITDIPNDEIINLHRESIKEIIDNMSENMQEYLFFYFGKEWVITYIDNAVRTIVIESTKKLSAKEEE